MSLYIDNQDSPQKEICRELRKIIFETFPNISEKMKWGVPSYAEGKYYFVSLKKHVNLGFSLVGLSEEEIKLFDGGGKTMKHLEIGSLNNLDKKKIVRLLRMVMKKAKPFHK